MFVCILYVNSRLTNSLILPGTSNSIGIYPYKWLVLFFEISLHSEICYHPEAYSGGLWKEKEM